MVATPFAPSWNVAFRLGPPVSPARIVSAIGVLSLRANARITSRPRPCAYNTESVVVPGRGRASHAWLVESNARRSHVTPMGDFDRWQPAPERRRTRTAIATRKGRLGTRMLLQLVMRR